MLKTACTLCGSHELHDVYSLQSIPSFQNKVYADLDTARNVPTSSMLLRQCACCQFVFNASFNAALMAYDSDYQNEQAHSICFQSHLREVADLLKKYQFHNLKGIEVGCGKGYFLEYLNNEGFDITGYDPAYTGNNKKIVKSYFHKDHIQQKADFVILRHVLEHVETPLNFLRNISDAVNQDALIYVEVPALEWILTNHAFWDIFHEHCNYFSSYSIRSTFDQVDQGQLFNGQYLYFITSLNQNNFVSRKISEPVWNFSNLTNQIDRYKQKFRGLTDVYLWGAGAKGVTFANIIDPERKLISGLIDINPNKQGHYVGRTGHKIYSPAIVNELNNSLLLIMNDNYFDEIKASLNNPKVSLATLTEMDKEAFHE